MEVSRRLQVTPDTVRTWRRRFLERGLDGLSDEPRPGVPMTSPGAAIVPTASDSAIAAPCAVAVRRVVPGGTWPAKSGSAPAAGRPAAVGAPVQAGHRGRPGAGRPRLRSGDRTLHAVTTLTAFRGRERCRRRRPVVCPGWPRYGWR
ncbi:MULTISPECIES: helix-turn-helix domain-containing protein [Streptomyces]|nr:MULTISPECIES: helix-turn-helix domain-containing protein [Streptomyces]